MIANYHTHTFRCGHAKGEDRAYVETAVARGLRVLGFSDHVPMRFADGHVSNFRVPVGQLEDYVNSVLSLRDEFKADIDVRLGFEMEYYPDTFEDTLALLRPYPVDYLLLAGHFNDSREAVYNPSMAQDRAALHTYVDRVTAGMETGAFTYVAHPDLFYFAGPDEVYTEEMTRLCETARALDVPLEINVLGLRIGRCYPNDRFWPIVKALGCRAVIGCDAHDPKDVADPEQLRLAADYAARFGVTPEEDIALRRPF